jgi:hypothetical protein
MGSVISSKVSLPIVSDKYTIVNIQNLERKEKEKYVYYGNYGPTIYYNKYTHKKCTQLQYVISKLAHSTEIIEEDIYCFKNTCEGTEQIYKENNFIGAFLEAYNNHCDIVIKPDDIWIMISLYFSNYVNDNSEKLRKLFVKHDDVKELIVKEFADSVEMSLNMEKNWDNFFVQISQQIKENTIENVVDLLECNFSTSTQIDKFISTAIIMNSFKKYFKYTRGICCCGINNVYFEGTLDDWINIISKTKTLKKYDIDGKLNNYIDKILIILNEFKLSFQGKPNVNFWNNIMNIESIRIGSGVDCITYLEGWITHFMGIYTKVDLDKIPDYTINVPIKLVNELTGITKDLNMFSNFISVSKVDKYLYKPDLALCIIEQKNEYVKPSYY